LAIKAISFDLWDTVIHDDSDEPTRKSMGLRSKHDERRHLVWDALKRAGHEVTPEAVAEAYDRADAAFNKAWKGDHVTWPIRERLTVLLKDLDLELPDALMDKLVKAHEEMEFVIKPDLVHGAPEAIRDLAGRYKLCVVSDAIVSPGSMLRQILRSHGIAHHFSSFAFSDEIGHSKPHRDMFQHVADELGVTFEEMVHVGDRDHNDIKGPQELGMKAVLFTATRDVDKANTSADAICERHADLPSIIDRLAAG
jgi:HAD superfamily hydrolase (TIGR01549 family)